MRSSASASATRAGRARARLDEARHVTHGGRAAARAHVVQDALSLGDAAALAVCLETQRARAAVRLDSVHLHETEHRVGARRVRRLRAADQHRVEICELRPLAAFDDLAKVLRHDVVLRRGAEEQDWRVRECARAEKSVSEAAIAAVQRRHIVCCSPCDPSRPGEWESAPLAAA